MAANFKIDLQTFIDNSEDMVGIFDTNYRLLAYNHPFADIFYRSDRIRVKPGMDLAVVLPADKRSIWTDQFTKALKGEAVKYEFPYEGSTGQFYYMENTFRPVVQNDDITCVIQVLKVITLRKKFEEKIQQSEKSLRHMAANIPNSDLFLLNENFDVIIVSGTDLKRKGYDIEEFVGQNMYDIAEKFGLKRLWEYYDKARNGIESHVEFEFEEDFYLDHIMPLRDDDNHINGFIVSSQRITDQKINQRKLEELNRSKDNILGIVAHDLRNPISAILGLADLVKNDVNHADKYFDLINTSCKTALNLISGLLEISDFDRPEYKLTTEYTELISFMKTIIQSNEVLAKEKELDIEFTSNCQEIEIEMNQSKFSRVINNLLANAIKFSHRKEKIEVNVELQLNRQCVMIRVADHGIGIPDAMKSIIFDKFTKAGRRGTEGEKSVGIGMSIVKRIVELHNGRIWLESKENEGTTVNIELKLPKVKITHI
ncbi:MAG: ATP-binding protein [Bacteroidia bacterium]